VSLFDLESVLFKKHQISNRSELRKRSTYKVHGIAQGSLGLVKLDLRSLELSAKNVEAYLVQ
jgi:hypothetical protein